MPWEHILQARPIEGSFRRQIDLRAWDAHTVVAWVEDDFHHFGLTLVHDGSHVRDVRIAAVRQPYTTCAGALAPLRELIGKPLSARYGTVSSMVDMRQNCTHLLDLATLAVTHAWSGRTHRRYHGTLQPLSGIKAGAGPALLRATLQRDGREVLAWDLDEFTILAPGDFAGRGILEGFRAWTDTLGVEAAEDALVLRRATFVGFGRRVAVEHVIVAADLGQGPVCHSFQPQWSSVALRIPGTRRRFDHDPGRMLGRLGNQP